LPKSGLFFYATAVLHKEDTTGQAKNGPVRYDVTFKDGTSFLLPESEIRFDVPSTRSSEATENSAVGGGTVVPAKQAKQQDLGLDFTQELDQAEAASEEEHHDARGLGSDTLRLAFVATGLVNGAQHKLWVIVENSHGGESKALQARTVKDKDSRAEFEVELTWESLRRKSGSGHTYLGLRCVESDAGTIFTSRVTLSSLLCAPQQLETTSDRKFDIPKLSEVSENPLSETSFKSFSSENPLSSRYSQVSRTSE
jgi:hypothetical protein